MVADLAVAWDSQSGVDLGSNVFNDFLLQGDHVVFIDAATKGLSSAAGIVITNSEGKVVEAFSVCLEAKSPWKLRHGLSSMRCNVVYCTAGHVNFASDCQTLVLGINSQKAPD
uniref:RNase H type-1 domain-containing protein n=1 Tax=Cannabis sativa TaxID=3483 RepID=A0A803PPK5_CANSA